MTTKFQKTLSILLSLFLIFFFVGCSSSNAGAPNAGAPTDTKTETTDNSSSDSTSTQKKTISYVTEDGKFEITESNYYRDSDGEAAVNIRVKNLTDEDYDYVRFDGYAIDSNGDKFENISANIWGIDANSSAYSNAYMGTGVQADSFGGIKLTGLSIAEKKDGSYYRNYSLDFDKKIVISMEEMNETDAHGNLK